VKRILFTLLIIGFIFSLIEAASFKAVTLCTRKYIKGQNADTFLLVGSPSATKVCLFYQTDTFKNTDSTPDMIVRYDWSPGNTNWTTLATLSHTNTAQTWICDTLLTPYAGWFPKVRVVIYGDGATQRSRLTAIWTAVYN
jgi:hypothetical protein